MHHELSKDGEIHKLGDVKTTPLDVHTLGLHTSNLFFSINTLYRINLERLLFIYSLIKCQCIGKELDLKVNGLMSCGELFMILFPIMPGLTLHISNKYKNSSLGMPSHLTPTILIPRIRGDAPRAIQGW